MVTMPAELPSQSLRLRVDRDALAENWRTLDRLSGSASAGAAVKADAYGIGARTAVPVLAGAGCRDFFVAHWAEAAAIIDLVEPGSISVLHGPLTEADAAWAQATGVRPVINSLNQAHLWLAAGGGPCDLMIDTGMNRLGLPLDQIGDEAIARLDIDVLLSHLASADEDCAMNALQRTRWQAVMPRVTHRRSSLANSAGIALGNPYHGELTRPGLSLYGGVPRPELEGLIRQVAHPEAAVIQTRQVRAGDTVGYNATFTAPRAMRVGVVALGYADGYLRCWSGGQNPGTLGGGGAMLWRGRRLPVLGRVSMDMTVIDLSPAPSLREGDWVAAEYDLPEAARISGLSQYELLTGLGRRFLR